MRGSDETLFRAYREERSAELRRQLVERWLPLARQLAAHYRVRDEAYEDLLQVASLGLLKSINGYELAGVLETTEERVLEARLAGDAYAATSLESQRGDDPDAPTLGDTLGVFDRGFHAAEDRATLMTLLVSIPDRDREILRLRFEEDLTQTQIAEIVGVSQMAVSRIIRRSIDRMRLAA